jgi:recombination protein RecT
VLVNTVTHRDMQEVIRKTLPASVSQERFTQAVVAALKHRPDLFMECDRASVYNAIVEAAKDGLLPDGRHGALVPFRSKEGPKRCQFLIMPEGIIDKLAKIGITAYAVSVYAGDKIRIWNDDHGQHVEHEPQTFGSRGDRIGAFACARIRESGSTYVEAMNMEDLEAPKKVTKSKDKNGHLIGPWADFPDRMEQKTCLHRICKRLPNVSMAEDEEFRGRSRWMSVLPLRRPTVAGPPLYSGSLRPRLRQPLPKSRPRPRSPSDERPTHQRTSRVHPAQTPEHARTVAHVE